MKPKQELRTLRNLYDLLPESDIACVKGCSSCCGPVSASRAELKAAPRLLEINTNFHSHFLAVKYNCAICPYIRATGSGCAIYDNRPFLCRLYGLSEEVPAMCCPYGPRTTRPLSGAQVLSLIDRYLKIVIDSGEEQQLRLAVQNVETLYEITPL